MPKIKKPTPKRVKPDLASRLKNAAKAPVKSYPYDHGDAC